MEVVSPKLDTTQAMTTILSDFWEAMRVHFNPQKDISCGGHVHVTPLSLNSKFCFRTLKKIAFACIVYEDFVASCLPQARRENKYCTRNSQSDESGVKQTLAWGKNAASLARVAAEIRSLTTEIDLYFYIQGSRYVLWNFQNIFPHPKTGRCTGTVEFRGGNQFLNTKGTLAWVAFVLGFITLASQEDLLSNFKSSSYVSPTDPSYPKRLNEWWQEIREAARKSKMSRHLPEDPLQMRAR